jgi:hypothetical protein
MTEQEFWSNVNKTESCWIWEGLNFTTHGNTYGYINVPNINGKNRSIVAHRYLYILIGKEIPEGFVIDHLCRNGLCVNPDHLEAVSNIENIMRGEGICAKNARKTHCKRGHELTPENTYNRKNGKRDCKLCDKERRAAASG